MTFRIAYNPGDSPVQSSDHGHSIGGQEWGVVDSTDETAQLALDSNWLNVVDLSAGDPAEMNPIAASALQRQQDYQARSDVLAGHTREDLFVLAQKNGMYEEDADMPLKRDLVSVLTYASHVPLGDLDSPEPKGTPLEKPDTAESSSTPDSSGKKTTTKKGE